MAGLIYGLCSLTAFTCCWLLIQAWNRSHYRLLLWGGLCFAGLTLNNILVLMDKFYVPNLDLSTWRLATALAAMVILLYGLIFDSE
jgi:hypothetical protein